MRNAKTIFSIAVALTAIVCHTAAGAASDAVKGHANGDAAALPDFDGDGTVGFGDFVIFAGVFGASQGDEKWEAGFDLDGDGGIGFSDFVIFAQQFGEAVSYDDRDALVAFYHATDGPNWVNNENWLTEAPLDEWFGVETNREGRVVELAMSYWDPQTERWISNGASGPIPPELGKLTNLRHLNFAGNKLSGPIPPGLGDLGSLTYLSLRGNNLSGPVPARLGDLANLEMLNLLENELSGPIPSSFLQLASLTRLYITFTGLCVPGTPDFLTWLRGIEDRDEPEDIFCNAADVAALRSLYEAAGGVDWTESAGWSGDGAVEEWHGVSADSLGRVTVLDLTRNGLSGQLPRDLGALSKMTELSIGGNSALSGRLPLGLIDVSLRTLHYSGTGLCAPGNASFRDWLVMIDSFEGTGAECPPLTDREILEALYEATGGPNWVNSENWLTDAPLEEWYGVEVDEQGTVTALRLFANGLEGSIPLELTALAHLGILNLTRNNLTGTIPPELANLSELWALWLGENRLSGAIPPKLASLSKLQEFSANENELSGTIPPELGDLPELFVLILSANRMTGGIPRELGGLSNLRELYVGNNKLTGPVPPEFGVLTQLTRLAMQGNAGMSGVLPASLTNLANLEMLQAEGTGLCAPSDTDFHGWLAGVPIGHVPTCDVDPAMAYLVQVVQSREFPVPLVAGKRALLRVFPTANRPTRAGIPAIRARFFVDGTETHAEDVPGKSDSIPSSVYEGSLSTSVNAEIPAHVIRPGLEMVIEVDPNGTLDPDLGVAPRIPETGRLGVDVRDMPFFDLTLVPFLWTAEPDSAVLEAAGGMSADPEGHEMLGPTRALLPVGELKVTAHEPVHSSSNNAYDLMAQTEAIRVMEGGTGYWMGLASGTVSGAAGLGGGEVSFSIDDADIIAHEFGHNFSLPHAPCGGAGNPDPAYPTSDGTIGVWGYDIETGGLVPPSTEDIMGYCDNESIAGYFFTKACHFRLDTEGEEESPAAVAAPPSRSLLLWGGVDAEGVPHLEPAFVVEALPVMPPFDGDEEYRLAARAVDGRVLFALYFRVTEIACGDGRGSFIFVAPIDPAWAADLSSITVTGPSGSDTLNGETDRPMAIWRDPQTGRVRGFLRDLPPSLVTQADVMAAKAAPPGLEVLFSRGIPENVIPHPDDMDTRR